MRKCTSQGIFVPLCVAGTQTRIHTRFLPFRGPQSRYRLSGGRRHARIESSDSSRPLRRQTNCLPIRRNRAHVSKRCVGDPVSTDADTPLTIGAGQSITKSDCLRGSAINHETRAFLTQVDSDSASIALLAIKPRFAQAIIAGDKTVEFRKIRFAQPPRYIVLYASTPIQQVIAFFEVVQIEELSVLGLWRKFRAHGGIDYREFSNYYSGRDRGFAIVVGSVWKLREPASLRAFCARVAPPQSFIYLRSSAIDRLLKRHSSRPRDRNSERKCRLS